jgi:hypothetical protein
MKQRFTHAVRAWYGLLLVVVALPGGSAWAQKKPAIAPTVIANVRLSVSGDSAIVVRYDLANVQPGDSLYLRFRSRNGELLKPDAGYVTGDIGTNLKPGRDKQIMWNARDNGIAINEELRAAVIARLGTPLQVSRGAGGPGYALLSLLAPGVGNIFVQSPDPVVSYRPLITVAAYGILVYGLLERGRVNVPYDSYQQAKNPTEGQPFYDEANRHYQRYFIATRTAAVIALTDAVLTAIHGFRNRQARAKKPGAPAVSIRPGWLGDQPVATLRLRF